MNLAQFEGDHASPEARRAVEAEAPYGREQLHVDGTPTLVLPGGTRPSWAIAYPDSRPAS